MPNHVTNIIRASKEVIAALRSEKSAVDFGVLIPMPAGLEDAQHSSNTVGIAEFICGKGGDIQAAGMTGAIARMGLSNTMTQIRKGGVLALNDGEFESFVQLLRNLRATGCATWYDWAPENWGTKWNAYDIKESEDGLSVEFDTAWGAPHPVVTALAAKFPEVCIEHQWADEDIGSNYGHRRYCGVVTELEIADGVAFGCGIKGYDVDEYRAERAEDEGDVEVEDEGKI